jgi:tryptophan-rich hypothetical protein
LINPKKLPHSKWTAAAPKNQEKHFLVTKLILPEAEHQAIIEVEIEAILTGRSFTLAWRELTDERQWLQGWQ